MLAVLSNELNYITYRYKYDREIDYRNHYDCFIHDGSVVNSFGDTVAMMAARNGIDMH